jgi:hypothetical protein
MKCIVFLRKIQNIRCIVLQYPCGQFLYKFNYAFLSHANSSTFFMSISHV